MTQDTPRGGQTCSVWQAQRQMLQPRTLDHDADADVCIVGAGMAGLCTAYQLARDGRSVIVLDAAGLAGGESARTTAHLASAIDDRFYVIERQHGADAARLCYESHATAIEWIETAVASEKISCGFERLEGYLFLPPGEDREVIERELAAAKRAGVAGVERVLCAPLPSYDTGPCLRFPQQAQFEPLVFLKGLIAALERMNVLLFGGTPVRQIEDDKGLRVVTESGQTVRAKSVVVATNSPINNVVTLHTKQHPYRTYVTALPVTPGSVTRALYWDTSQDAGDTDGSYHYVRLHHPQAAPGQSPADHELLIVGGEDHKTGQADDASPRWSRLEAWARERFPLQGPAAYQWSGQVLEPVDHVAFIGRNPTGPEDVYVITGDSGQGMTHSAIGAMLVTDLIAGRENPWAALYDPSRRTLASAFSYASENLNMAAQYTDWLRAGDVASVAEIATGSGALVRSGLKLLACYRDPGGALHPLSAACTHLGGVVQWNSAEKTWDCPCHGSRFDPCGAVISGPAVAPLAAADDTPDLPKPRRVPVTT